MFEKPRSVPPKKFSFLVFSSVAFVFVRFDIVFIRYRFDSWKKPFILVFFLVSTLPPERSLINPSGVDVRRWGDYSGHRVVDDDNDVAGDE